VWCCVARWDDIQIGPTQTPPLVYQSLPNFTKQTNRPIKLFFLELSVLEDEDIAFLRNITNRLSNNSVTYQLTWILIRLLCKTCCIDQKEFSIHAQAMDEFLLTCIPGVETSQSVSDTSVSWSISFSRDLFWWPSTSTLYTAHTWSYPDLIVKRKWRATNFVSCNEFTWWQSSVLPISVKEKKK